MPPSPGRLPANMSPEERFERYSYMPGKILCKLNPQEPPDPDLLQCGYQRLWEECVRYEDNTSNTPFPTTASNALSRHFQNLSAREKHRFEENTSLSALNRAEWNSLVAEEIELPTDDIFQLVQGCLTRQERLVIDLLMCGFNLTEIGKLMGLSKQRIRQIRLKVRRKT